LQRLSARVQRFPERHRTQARAGLRCRSCCAATVLQDAPAPGFLPARLACSFCAASAIRHNQYRTYLTPALAVQRSGSARAAGSGPTALPSPRKADGFSFSLLRFCPALAAAGAAASYFRVCARPARARWPGEEAFEEVRVTFCVCRDARAYFNVFGLAVNSTHCLVLWIWQAGGFLFRSYMMAHPPSFPLDKCTVVVVFLSPIHCPYANCPGAAIHWRRPEQMPLRRAPLPPPCGTVRDPDQRR
jgi:hypothetical protein